MPSQPEIDSLKDSPQADGYPSPDLTCGIEKNLVETFLKLIRDNYNKVDMAAFFLEQRTGIINIQGVTNVRDVLGHLANFLQPELTPDQREEQINAAAEHLRRAVTEPYEVAVNELLSRFAKLYERYKQELLPVRDEHVPLSTAPSPSAIEARLVEIQNLRREARNIKNENMWSPEWEQGVVRFAEAFDKLAALYSDIESYWYKFEQIERDLAKAEQLDVLAHKIQEISKELAFQYKRERLMKILLVVFCLAFFALASLFWLKR